MLTIITIWYALFLYFLIILGVAKLFEESENWKELWLWIIFNLPLMIFAKIFNVTNEVIIKLGIKKIIKETHVKTEGCIPRKNFFTYGIDPHNYGGKKFGKTRMYFKILITKPDLSKMV